MSMFTQEQAEDIAQHISELYKAAMASEHDTVIDAMRYIAGTYGDRGIYAVCTSLAGIVEHMLIPEGEKKAGFAAIEPLVEVLDESAPDLWAARFFVAHLNEDHDQKIALYNAISHDPPRVVQCVAAMIKMAKDAGEHRLHTRRAKGN